MATTPVPADLLPKLDPTVPYMIVSADSESGGLGAIAFTVPITPPAGPVSLMPIPAIPLLAPMFLWVPVSITKQVFQIVYYPTLGTPKPLLLTGTVSAATVTVTAADPTNTGQLWTLVPQDKDSLTTFTVENVLANGAAIQRSTLHPVPGSQLELGPARDLEDSHTIPYRYHFVAVGAPPPVKSPAPPPGTAPDPVSAG